MNTLRGCGLAAVALLIAATARSANVSDQNSAGPEFGIGLGQAVLEAKIPGVASGSESATGFNLLGGYRFDRYLSVEAGYLHGGHFTVPGGRFQLTAAQLSAVGTLPIGNYFALFARGGADHWWATDSGFTNRFLCGGGAQTFFDGALVRLEYQQSAFHDENIDDLSVHVRHEYIGLGRLAFLRTTENENKLRGFHQETLAEPRWNLGPATAEPLREGSVR